jgi:hypothetical protein
LDRRVSSDNEDGPARLAEILRARVSLSAVGVRAQFNGKWEPEGRRWGGKPSSEARQKAPQGNNASLSGRESKSNRCATSMLQL